MKLLRRLVAWWRGTADPVARREAERVQETIDLDRAEAVFGAGQTNKTGG